MSQEILNLLYFYRSVIGKITHETLLKMIHRFWTEPPKKIIGIGYTDPFLDYFHKHASDCLALTPSFTGAYARTGVESYPTALIQETDLPLKPESHSHILCIHMIEHCAYPDHFLQEAFKALKAEGEMIFVVPNRHGVWARNENTPFGSGQPYTKKQLYKLIQNAGFIITDYQPVLFTRPRALPVTRYYSHIIEKIGSLFFPRYSGLHIIRALKRVYVPPVQTSKEDLLNIMPVINGLLPNKQPAR